MRQSPRACLRIFETPRTKAQAVQINVFGKFTKSAIAPLACRTGGLPFIGALQECSARWEILRNGQSFRVSCSWGTHLDSTQDNRPMGDALLGSRRLMA